MSFSSIRQTWYSRLICLCLMITFVATMVVTPRASYAQAGVMGLPQPGTMVNLSSAYVPLMIVGLRVHPKDPLLMDFIVNTGNSNLNDDQIKNASDRLIKYFLACLTIPEKDQWVNLSPYEKQRIVPEDLGGTVLGQDMLAQDYLLKQLTASLIYPERNLGKEFWEKVYAKARQEYGTTRIPVNTFNKVWILPDSAKVYEHKDTVLVVKSHLKVMLDEDYLALSKHGSIPATNNLGSQVVRQIVLPAIEQEVNGGKNFAQMRQIYNSMILAVWFKNNLKQAFLNQVYTDRSKINGVNADDPAIKQKIYQQYLQAYKKGVFNYIKEDIDQSSQQMVPHKYFSGGLTGPDYAMIKHVDSNEAYTVMENGPGKFRVLYSQASGVGRDGSAMMPATDSGLDQNGSAIMSAMATGALQSEMHGRKFYLWQLRDAIDNKIRSMASPRIRVFYNDTIIPIPNEADSNRTSQIIRTLASKTGRNNYRQFNLRVDSYHGSVILHITDAAMTADRALTTIPSAITLSLDGLDDHLLDVLHDPDNYTTTEYQKALAYVIKVMRETQDPQVFAANMKRLDEGEKLEFTIPVRLFDGPGSSFDLKALKKLVNKFKTLITNFGNRKNGFKLLPTLTAFISSINKSDPQSLYVTVTFEKGPEGKIVYDAVDYPDKATGKTVTETAGDVPISMGSVTKSQVEEYGREGVHLDWQDISSKLVDYGWADKVEIVKDSRTVIDDSTVRLKPDWNRSINDMESVFGVETLKKVLPLLEHAVGRGRLEGGQKNAADFYVGKLFGVKGLKVTLKLSNPDVIKGGGLESSNGFNAALAYAMRELTGSKLTHGQLFGIGLSVANGPLSDLTGLQGWSVDVFGNGQMIYLDEVKDAAGKRVKPGGLVFVPITNTEKLSQGILLAGLNVPVEDSISRTATLINTLWTFLVDNEDAPTVQWQARMLELSHEYANAARDGDIEKFQSAMTEYVQLRDNVTKRAINLLFDAKEGKSVPHYAERFAKIVFEDSKDPGNTYAAQFSPLREFYYRGANQAAIEASRGLLRRVSIYSWGFSDEMRGYMQAHGIAGFCLGAGGPGANWVFKVKQMENSEAADKVLADFQEKFGSVLKNPLRAKIGNTPMQAAWVKPDGEETKIDLLADTTLGQVNFDDVVGAAFPVRANDWLVDVIDRIPPTMANSQAFLAQVKQEKTVSNAVMVDNQNVLPRALASWQDPLIDFNGQSLTAGAAQARMTKGETGYLYVINLTSGKRRGIFVGSGDLALSTLQSPEEIADNILTLRQQLVQGGHGHRIVSYTESVVSDRQPIQVLIKPEATDTKGAIEDALRFFRQHGYGIQNITLWQGPDLKRESIARRHYGISAQAAVEGRQYIEKIPALKEKLLSGLKVADGDYKDMPVYGGQELVEKGLATMEESNDLWKEGTAQGNNARLGPGVYAVKVQFKGKEIILINGYMPYLIDYFENPKAVTIALRLAPLVDQEATPLLKLRDALGNTDLKKTEPGTLRRQYFDKLNERGLLGIFEENPKAINGYHLSASYIEALYECVLWGADLHAQPLAQRLVSLGMSWIGVENLVREQPKDILDATENLTSEEQVAQTIIAKRPPEVTRDVAMTPDVQRMLGHLNLAGIDQLTQQIEQAVSGNNTPEVNALYHVMSNVNLYALQEDGLLRWKDMLYQYRAQNNIPETWLDVDPITGEKTAKVFCDMEGTALNPDPKQKLNELIIKRNSQLKAMFDRRFALKNLIDKPISREAFRVIKEEALGEDLTAEEKKHETIIFQKEDFRRIIKQMLGEHITSEDLQEATKNPTIIPRFLEILNTIKETTQVDRLDLVFVTGSYTQQARGYWESDAFKEAVAKSGLKIQIVDSRTDTIEFKSEGQNVMRGPLNIQGNSEPMLVKDGFVPNDAIYIGDKEEQSEGPDNKLQNRLEKRGITFFSVDTEKNDEKIRESLREKTARHSAMTTSADMALNVAGPGGIDLNSKNLNLEREGQKVSIAFDAAMIAQFRRGDFSGVKIQILDVVPISLVPLLGLREEESGQLAHV